jgi:hypothetical protein
MVSAFTFIAVIFYSRPKNQTLVNKNRANGTTIIKPRKIFSLAPESVEAE